MLPEEPITPAPERLEFPSADDDFGLTPQPKAKAKAKLKRPDPLLGVDLGGVQITKLISEGGMGRVYEAHQTDPDRVVAVKIVRHGITHEKTLQRFEREADILSKLQHPFIAQIYAVGTYESDLGDVPFFVMEYVANAKPITNYAHEHGLELRERLRLFKQVCEAVAHGHDRGIVHRDLKPGNILIGADGTPKVIDFGVARSTDSDLTLTKLRTDTGQLIGTLQYMSPEQFGDSPSAISGRADVYSLGVVLYELVSGVLPYELRRKAMHEITRIVCEEIPPSLRSRDKSCPREVSLITECCLQKDRRHRYHTAGELAADLGRFLERKPISARPSSRTKWFLDRAKRTLRNSQLWFVASLVVVAIVLGPRIWSEPEPRAPAPNGPAAVPAAGVGLPRSPEEEFKGRLTSTWTESGLTVTRGECYRILALGTTYVGDTRQGPEGDARLSEYPDFGYQPTVSTLLTGVFHEGFPRFAVLARINGDDRAFYVGEKQTFIAPRSGRLAFRLNMPPEFGDEGGNFTIGIERVREPLFCAPDGTTTIRARVHGKECLVFTPDGVRWEREQPTEANPVYPVMINEIAWWPEWVTPTESAVLKTREFAWAAPLGGFSGPLPMLERWPPLFDGIPEVIRRDDGVLVLQFEETKRNRGQLACKLSPPQPKQESSRGPSE